MSSLVTDMDWYEKQYGDPDSSYSRLYAAGIPRTAQEENGFCVDYAISHMILYADHLTKSISNAINEVERRRKYQLKMNKKYNITPKTIEKPIREKLVFDEEETGIEKLFYAGSITNKTLPEIDVDSLTST